MAEVLQEKIDFLRSKLEWETDLWNMDYLLDLIEKAHRVYSLFS